MADLPQEVIIEILCRLSVKILLRLRCVSKSWRSLIDGSDFLELHLKKSLENRTNISLVLRKHSDLFSVCIEALDDIVKLNHPLMCYSNKIRVFGSCNGLLCICNVAEDISYWNPSTRKYRILPSLPAERRKVAGPFLFFARVYGFGYDAVHDDYKLVRISQFVRIEHMGFESEVLVYSLRTNCWKLSENVTCVFHTRKMGVLCNGALHWVVTKEWETEEEVHSLVAFDIASETLKGIGLPECMGTSKFKMDVWVFDGCLCLLANYPEIRHEVWVMKEYGVGESWTKFFTISQPDMLKSFSFVKPLAYSNTGRKVLLEQDNEKLVWFDLKGQQLINSNLRGFAERFDSEVCVGSFVSPLACRENNGKKNDSLTGKKRDDFLSEGFKLVL